MDSLWHCFNHMTREQFQSCWLNQVPNDQLGSPKATTDQPEVPKPRSCRGQVAGRLSEKGRLDKLCSDQNITKL
jgi:hypothetical protein